MSKNSNMDNVKSHIVKAELSLQEQELIDLYRSLDESSRCEFDRKAREQLLRLKYSTKTANNQV